MQVLFEIMVQNKQKGGTGVESPPPRSFSRGFAAIICSFAAAFVRIARQFFAVAFFVTATHVEND